MKALPLYGVTELAAATGQRRDTISQWYRRGKTPKPAARLAMGPVWMGDDVAAWIEAHRKSGSEDQQVDGTGIGTAPTLDVGQREIVDALSRLGFPTDITSRVADELTDYLLTPAGRTNTALGPWSIERATQLVNELGADRPAPPPPPARGAEPEEEDLCPHGRAWLSCEVCAAAGEELKRRGVQALWSALKAP